MFDRLVRYLPILDYIRQHHPHRILEVGSGPRGLGEFYDQKFTGVDLKLSENPIQNMSFVQASASKLPFPDASFDLVICIDVLEHIPERERGKVVKEMIRVAFRRIGNSDNGNDARIEKTLTVRRQPKRVSLPFADSRIVNNRAVIIGYPCGQGAVELSKKMYHWFKKRGSGTAKWMEEHVKFGLPDENLFESFFVGEGLSTLPGFPAFDWVGRVKNPPLRITKINNENLKICEWLLKLEENGHWLKLEKILYVHFRPLVEFFLRRVSFGKCYRKIWIIE